MSAASLSTLSFKDGDSRLTKGQTSRAAILLAAAKLATTKGMNGLSIGGLATEVGMSKSGLYAHFQSKDILELATIELAATIFDEEVIQPANKIRAGSERLMALVSTYLFYLERKTFPGGCFFAAVALELDTRPGPARDKVLQVLNRWLSLLKQSLLDGQALGEINPKAEVDQAVFEIEAMLLSANFLFVMTHDPLNLAQARMGVEHILARLKVGARNK